MSTSKPPSAINSQPPIRILCLHGYTQSGPVFSSKTGALRKALTAALAPRPVEFRYPTGPLALRPEDIPGYEPPADPSTASEDKPDIEVFGWWRRQGPRIVPSTANRNGTTTGTSTNDTPEYTDEHGNAVSEDDIVYTGFEDGLATIAQCIREHGPFDGVIGFSQGACAAAMLAALLERAYAISGIPGMSLGDLSTNSGKQTVPETISSLAPFLKPFFESEQPIQVPLKFAILYSGFRTPGRRYAGFWTPQIATPSLHVRGGLDTVVDEARSEALVDTFQEDSRRVLVHPGGHFVPNQKMWTTAVLVFVKEILDKKE